MPDNMTPEQRSFTMSRIRSKDTKVELQLRRVLHRRGLRYRVHKKDLPGKPDIAFTRQQVAVFVDGDFWHGWKFEAWKHKLKPYWRDKIERNRARDRKRNLELREMGWKVVRVWEHELKGDVAACADRVEEAVRRRSTSP